MKKGEPAGKRNRPSVPIRFRTWPPFAFVRQNRPPGIDETRQSRKCVGEYLHTANRERMKTPRRPKGTWDGAA
jgi:hypothetical protein